MNKQPFLTLIACLFLFMGIGRIFSLVVNDPVLGYANNYDMIRLQACHQIWPADKFIDSTVGTPSAPIRRYTLDKHVDTLCFPSSELLFTGIGIELGKLKNKITGEVLISIKTIGFVKATFLSLTILLASLFFYRKEMYAALFANAAITLAVLSDPGVTLYMNTFYTEFSAVYFLYLTLVGIAVFAKAHYRFTAAWVLLIGLVGLGFSKPQHAPLALGIALLLSIYIITKKQWATAPIMLLCAALPFILQAGGWYTPRNDSMIRTDNINLVGSMLGISNTPDSVLADWGLPASCSQLAGRNGYDATLQKTHVCPEVDKLSATTALYTLIQHPTLSAHMIERMLIQQKNWVFDLYGQVERGRTEPTSHYQRTINSVLQFLPNSLIVLLPFIVALVAIVLLVAGRYRSGAFREEHLYLLLLIAAQAIIIVNAILQGGTVGAAKSSHLYFAVSIAALALLVITPKRNS